MSRWTEDEKALLRDTSLSLQEVSDRTGRPYGSCISKASQEGIRRPRGVRAAPVEVGQRFGRLVVVDPDVHVQSGKQRPRGALLRCDCGSMTEVVLSSLRGGFTRSCGCLETEARRMPKVGTRRLFVKPGQRFGRLVVVDPEGPAHRRSGRTDRYASLRCDCGSECSVALSALIRGYTRSCGCLQADLSQVAIRAAQAANVTHNLYHHPLYRIWQGMLARCENPNSASYPRYGGRGITVCEAWHDVMVFITDIEREIGPRPEGRHASGVALYSLDRKNSERGYAPGNVQWATAREQALNRSHEVALRRLHEENVQLRTRIAELEHRLAWSLGD
jgi:hypothetical protein